MTVEQLRRYISDLAPGESERLAREILAVARYQRAQLDLSSFTLEAGLASLADASNLLRQYGVEPRPDDLTTLEGMLASLESGALGFIAEDEELYTEADLRERY